MLAGDADGNRVTNDVDVNLTWQNVQRPLAKQDPALDLNDDGTISFADVEEALGNYLATMPAPAPGPAMAPPVLDLSLGGSWWSGRFAADGREGGRPVAPWSGLDRIGLAVPDGATVSSESLDLIDADGARLELGRLSIDADAGTARWNLATSLTNGLYEARVDLTGNGVADAVFSFEVLEGDVNGDGFLTQADLESIEAALGTAAAREDLNRNGLVDADDVARMNAILSKKER